MTMPRMQLNSKFVNNMLPEWSRFITEVKLNRGLKESNFDQLYAYLKQHEVHANENRIMMERFIKPNNDPLALVSDASVQQYPTQSSKSHQSSKATTLLLWTTYQLDSGSPQQKLIESLSHIAPHSITGKLWSRFRGRLNAPKKETISKETCKRLSRFKTTSRDKDATNASPGEWKPYWMKKHVVVLAGEQVTNVMMMWLISSRYDLALNVDHIFEADECDAFDSDVDEGSTSQTMFMTNLTSEDPIYDEARPSYDSE
ncbi:hypothetical protein Tco_0705476 [Tanacetum coccineum]|uniref:Uncharacterized protein n=1 Tax=Tanacetum coccineum TaxID=301880 RepID=A0ABQ4Y5K2_9ASTR